MTDIVSSEQRSKNISAIRSKKYKTRDIFQKTAVFQRIPLQLKHQENTRASGYLFEEI